jgi:hypothetical protein
VCPAARTKLPAARRIDPGAARSPAPAPHPRARKGLDDLLRPHLLLAVVVAAALLRPLAAAILCGGARVT